MLDKYATSSQESYDFPTQNSFLFNKHKAKAQDWGSVHLLKFSSGEKENKIDSFRIQEKKSMDLSSYAHYFISKDRSSENAGDIARPIKENFSLDSFDDTEQATEAAGKVVVKAESLDYNSMLDNDSEIQNLALFNIGTVKLEPEEAKPLDSTVADLADLLENVSL